MENFIIIIINIGVTTTVNRLTIASKKHQHIPSHNYHKV